MLFFVWRGQKLTAPPIASAPNFQRQKVVLVFGGIRPVGIQWWSRIRGGTFGGRVVGGSIGGGPPPPPRDPVRRSGDPVHPTNLSTVPPVGSHQDASSLLTSPPVPLRGDL